MFLSEFELDAHILHNPYEIHKILWKAFPGRENEDRPFLFRVAYDKPGKNVKALMQSLLKPETAGLNGTLKMIRSKSCNPHLRDGQKFRFRICANPVKRLSKERVRVPLIKEEEQKEWLQRLIGAGAEVLDCVIIEKRILYFRKQGNQGKIVTVTFEGILTVTDSKTFLSTIKSGIGPAKSFGCGMISLAGG